MKKYRIIFDSIGRRTGNCIFRLEKFIGNIPLGEKWELIYCGVQADCEQYLKQIVEGEKEVIVVPFHIQEIKFR